MLLFIFFAQHVKIRRYKVGAFIDDWKSEAMTKQQSLISDLQQLISIPSVLDEQSATRMRHSVRDRIRALEWLLEEGRKEGFTVKNIDNMAGGTTKWV